MTIEEAAKKYGGKKIQANAADVAQKYGGQPTQQAATAQPPQEEKKKGFGRKVVDFFTSSTQKFGKTVGDAINAPKAAEMYGEELLEHTDLQNKLITAIKKKKSLGQDTSQLEGALQAHLEATPKLEDYTGDVINKTTGQVLGEAGGTVLEALSGGVVGKGSQIVTKAPSTAQKVIQSAKLGGAYGAASGAADAAAEGENVITGALKGGATGAIVGGGIGTVGALKLRKVGSMAGKAEETAGRVLLSEKADQKVGAKVLKTLDPKKVKTYDDLVATLEQDTKGLRTSQDKHLSKDLAKRKVNALDSTIDVDGTKVKHNFVKDAVDELLGYYKSSNNIKGQTEMKNLAAKLRKEGVTTKEINDLARRHGKDLNAFNASGELSSGLSKQAAENTRSGLKELVGTLDKSGKSRALDKDMSEKLKVLSLAKDAQTKIQNFKNKAEKVGLLRKAGAKIGKVADLASGGFLKGALRAMQGFGDTKQLNYGQIEQQLSKNLRLLQKLEKLDLTKETEESLARKISDFINQEVNIK